MPEFDFGGTIVWRPDPAAVPATHLGRFMAGHGIGSFDQLLERTVHVVRRREGLVVEHPIVIAPDSGFRIGETQDPRATVTRTDVADGIRMKAPADRTPQEWILRPQQPGAPPLWVRTVAVSGRAQESRHAPIGRCHLPYLTEEYLRSGNPFAFCHAGAALPFEPAHEKRYAPRLRAIPRLGPLPPSDRHLGLLCPPEIEIVPLDMHGVVHVELHGVVRPQAVEEIGNDLASLRIPEIPRRPSKRRGKVHVGRQIEEPPDEPHALERDARLIGQELAEQMDPRLLQPPPVRERIPGSFALQQLPDLQRQIVETHFGVARTRDLAEGSQDQHAAVDRVIRVLEVPSEESRFLPTVGEREHFPPVLRQELVKSRGDDRVWAVRSVRDLADGILRSVAAPAAPANLIFVALPLVLEDETKRRPMAAGWLLRCGRLLGDPAALRAEVDETGRVVPGPLVR